VQQYWNYNESLQLPIGNCASDGSDERATNDIDDELSWSYADILASDDLKLDGSIISGGVEGKLIGSTYAVPISSKLTGDADGETFTNVPDTDKISAPVTSGLTLKFSLAAVETNKASVFTVARSWTSTDFTATEYDKQTVLQIKSWKQTIKNYTAYM